MFEQFSKSSFYTWSLRLSRPSERSGEDVDIILARLKNVKALERFHPRLLQQICLCGFYERLEKGITCRLKPNKWKDKQLIKNSPNHKSFDWSFFLYSVSAGRHRYELVCCPVWFPGCESLWNIELSGTAGTDVLIFIQWLISLREKKNKHSSSLRYWQMCRKP